MTTSAATANAAKDFITAADWLLFLESMLPLMADDRWSVMKNIGERFPFYNNGNA